MTIDEIDAQRNKLNYVHNVAIEIIKLLEVVEKQYGADARREVLQLVGECVQ